MREAIGGTAVKLGTSASKLASELQRKGGTDMHLLWWIIVGLIAGWATGKIMRGAGYGAFTDIILGIVGAIIGGAIMRSLGFAGQGGTLYTILVAIGGAIILTAIIRLITGGRSRLTTTNRTGRGGFGKAA